jgi:glutamate dehydrogenase (NADP+)
MLLLPLVWVLLQEIMVNIYKSAADAAKEFNVSLQDGANIAGFLKIARAMHAQGCV